MKNFSSLFLQILTTFSLVFFSLPLIGQSHEKCGFDHMMEIAKRDNPTFELTRSQIEDFTANYVEDRSGAVTDIPTVIHVVHNGEAVGTWPNMSDVQLNSAISNLNEAFQNTGPYASTAYYNSPMNVNFVLAQVKPDGGTTTGIERHDISAKAYAATYNSDGISSGSGPGVPQATLFADYLWNPQDYMNVWIVKKIDGIDVGSGDAGTLGYATLPLSNPGTADGLVCQARAFGYNPSYGGTPTSTWDFGTANISGNGTADHEVGHYLNLQHTFNGDQGGSTCPPVSGTVGTDDDGCPDIAPHKRTQSVCPAYNSTGNSCVTPNGPNEYIYNFMNYSSDPCFQGFSADQVTRCHAAIDGPRKAFKTSTGATTPTGSYPAAVTATVNGPSTDMGIFDVTLNGTTFTSQSGYHDGGYLNRIASQPTVELAYSTPYTMTVQVGVGDMNVNPELVDVYIDYNNDASFDAATERVYHAPANEGKNNGAAFSFSFTTPASGGTTPAATRLRMRVISGFANGGDQLGDDATADFDGNIEDYSVSFGAPLPVSLVDFNAIEKNQTAYLTWNTASEINNHGFEVQRSLDARNFKVIGFAEGAGTTLEAQSYEFIDRDVRSGAIYYYRLKQLDFDGKYEFSDVNYLRFSDFKSDVSDVSVYPNPVNDYLTIANGIGQVTIYNGIGKLFRSFQVVDELTDIDVSDLPKGHYFIRIHTPNNQLVTKRFVK